MVAFQTLVASCLTSSGGKVWCLLPWPTSSLRAWSTTLLYLHNRSVLHRDLKPSNVLCISTAHIARTMCVVAVCSFIACQEWHVVIADFGLARAVRLARDGHFTKHVATLWHPHFAPEVFCSGPRANPQSNCCDRCPVKPARGVVSCDGIVSQTHNGVYCGVGGVVHKIRLASSPP